jgi:hypothetical protein
MVRRCGAVNRHQHARPSQARSYWEKHSTSIICGTLRVSVHLTSIGGKPEANAKFADSKLLPTSATSIDSRRRRHLQVM